MAGGIVLGSIAVPGDVLPYISVVIIASFFKFNMCNTSKNSIAKMFLFFSQFKIVDLEEFFLFFKKNLLRTCRFSQIQSVGTSKPLVV